MAKVLELPLIQAKTINWFLRGTLSGGFMWLIFLQMWKIVDGSELNVPMFVSLPIWLVAGFVWSLFMRSR